MSGAKGALSRPAELPRAKRLLGDKNHDGDWLRNELKARGPRICLPARRPDRHNR
jgi:hypothetical protein